MIGSLSYDQGFARNQSESVFPERWNGLIGLWAPSLGPTGQTLFDLSGFGNDGTLTGMELDTDWIISGNPRLPGSALEFGADVEFVNFGTQLSAAIAGLTGFTVIISVNYDSSGSAEHTLFSNWTVAANTGNILIRLEPSNDSVEAFVITQTATQIGGSFLDLTVTPNEWNNVVLRFDSLSGEGLSCFVNGIKSATTFASSAAVDGAVASEDLYIGSSPHIEDDLVGKIDYVSLYDYPSLDSQILSEAENPLAVLYLLPRRSYKELDVAPPGGRIMSSLVGAGGLAGRGGIAGPGGGLAA